MAKYDNASDKKSLDKKQLTADFESDEERKDFLEQLESPGGRRVLWNLLTHCRIYEDSFTGNSHTFHNEGRRSVGLHILGKIMNAKPEAYLQMMQDAKRKEDSND